MIITSPTFFHIIFSCLKQNIKVYPFVSQKPENICFIIIIAVAVLLLSNGKILDPNNGQC